MSVGRGAQRAWRERSLGEKAYYPYLYLDATTYLKLRWGASVTSMALVSCVWVDEGGFREVLGVEVGPGLLGEGRGLRLAVVGWAALERGLKGVRLVVSLTTTTRG